MMTVYRNATRSRMLFLPVHPLALGIVAPLAPGEEITWHSAELDACPGLRDAMRVLVNEGWLAIESVGQVVPILH